MNMFWGKSAFIFLLVVLVTAAIFVSVKINPPQQIITNITGNIKVLSEINALLPSLEARNITSHSFDKLASLTSQDEYVQGEIVELRALAEDREYSHIGHGLGFIYQYVITGSIPICPGHSLSHYYVFSRHNQTNLAGDNLNDSKSLFGEWANSLILKNNTNMTEVTEFENNFHTAILQIDSGNSTASDDQINYFADAVCASISSL